MRRLNLLSLNHQKWASSSSSSLSQFNISINNSIRYQQQRQQQTSLAPDELATKSSENIASSSPTTTQKMKTSRRRINFIASQKPGIPVELRNKARQAVINNNNSEDEVVHTQQSQKLEEGGTFHDKFSSPPPPPASSSTTTTTNEDTLSSQVTDNNIKKQRSKSPLRAPKISHHHHHHQSSSTTTPSSSSQYFETESSQPLPANQRPRTEEEFYDKKIAKNQVNDLSAREKMRMQHQLPLRKKTMSAALAEKKEHDMQILALGTEMMGDLSATTKAFDAMDPDTRRYIVVAAASEEWFGTPEVKSKLKEADALSDQRICATDYEQWIAMSMRKRLETIPRAHFWTLMAFFGAPFFAMGFLDNCVFIVAGDVFDTILWNSFGVSGMICAGFGGIVAGTVGLQVHGVAARLMSRTVTMPETTNAQRGSKAYKVAKHWGGVLGLVFGLCGGMFPLLFLNRERD